MAPGQAVRLIRALGLAFVGVAVLVAQLGAQNPLTNVIVQWDPNPTADNVTGYLVTVDGGAPVSITLGACSASTCQAPVNGLPLGTHTIGVQAVNEWGTSAGTPVTFNINIPTVVKTVKVKKAP